MNFRLFLYIIILLGAFFVAVIGDNKKTRKVYIWTVILILIFQSCLRNIVVGPDTNSYYTYFLSMQGTSWSSIWQSFIDVYMYGDGKDAGYPVLMKAIQIFSTNWQIYLFVLACIFFIPLGIIFNKYSTHILQLVFAFTLFAALFNIITLSGMRQQVAMGFSFMAFLCLVDDKKSFFFITIVLGSFVHITLLVFILLFVIKCLFRNRLKLVHGLSFLVLPVSIFSSGMIVSYVASYFVNDYYSGYGQGSISGGAATYVILIEMLSLFSFIFIRKKNILTDTALRSFYSNLPLITFLSPFILLDGTLIRLGQYFTVYLMLIVPYAIDSIRSNRILRISIYWIMIITLMALSLKQTSPYYFFWQTIGG